MLLEQICEPHHLNGAGRVPRVSVEKWYSIVLCIQSQAYSANPSRPARSPVSHAPVTSLDHQLPAASPSPNLRAIAANSSQLSTNKGRCYFTWFQIRVSLLS